MNVYPGTPVTSPEILLVKVRRLRRAADLSAGRIERERPGSPMAARWRGQADALAYVERMVVEMVTPRVKATARKRIPVLFVGETWGRRTELRQALGEHFNTAQQRVRFVECDDARGAEVAERTTLRPGEQVVTWATVPAELEHLRVDCAHDETRQVGSDAVGALVCVRCGVPVDTWDRR